jgi:hypothetical protein
MALNLSALQERSSPALAGPGEMNTRINEWIYSLAKENYGKVELSCGNIKI